MKSKSFFSILLIVAGVIIAGYISYFSFKETQRNRQIEKEINNLRTEAENLKQNNQEMTDKIAYFETPEFQEKIAKEKLNLQKEDENVAVIKANPASKDKQNNQEMDANKVAIREKTNYEKWWDYFFKY